jgi:hypothetical protein
MEGLGVSVKEHALALTVKLLWAGVPLDDDEIYG